MSGHFRSVFSLFVVLSLALSGCTKKKENPPAAAQPAANAPQSEAQSTQASSEQAMAPAPAAVTETKSEEKEKDEADKTAEGDKGDKGKESGSAKNEKGDKEDKDQKEESAVPEALTEGFLNSYETGNMSPSEKRGRLIWYLATGGNAAFHSYVIPQRFNVYIDWDMVLNSKNRDQRFSTWGLVNDPDCKPGDASTFGFDKCPGDDELLKYVGKSGYDKVDPACNLEKTVPGDKKVGFKQEDSCKLAFGTSTGVVGFRKFPNPKYKEAAWKKINDGELTYKNYHQARLTDGSVEPPFLIGISCASCHVGLSPTHPPKDVEHPEWRNIIGTFGAQHLRMSEILGSGMPRTNILFQALANAEPGTTDTSAFSHDEVFNPGTMNAIMNFDIRIAKNKFKHKVTRQYQDKQTGKFSAPITKEMDVPQILKGGEDSVGADLAVQRVYINIGMCSRECWANNLMNMKSLTGRNAVQSEFKIEQCRKDCGEWRAIEHRIDDLVSFLVSRRPTDLKDAVDSDGNAIGQQKVDAIKAAKVKVNDQNKPDPNGTKEIPRLELGRLVFNKNCAECHSSTRPTDDLQPRDESFFNAVDFFKTEKVDIVADGKVVRTDERRVDWMGDDKAVAVLEGKNAIQTNYCRALHSNHTKGHIWSQFAAESYQDESTRPYQKSFEAPDREGDKKRLGGGRGYYRNLSLLSVWSTAPFLHNNAMGPKLCNNTPFFIEAQKKMDPNSDLAKYFANCIPVERLATIDGRLEMFEKSMTELLNPDLREKDRYMRTYEDIEIELSSRLVQDWGTMLPHLTAFATGAGDLLAKLGGKDPAEELGKIIANNPVLKLKIPKGFPVYAIASIDEKAFVTAQLDEVANSGPIPTRYKTLKDRVEKLSSDPKALEAELLKYNNCHDRIENKGHIFGTDLGSEEKTALIDFLKLL